MRFIRWLSIATVSLAAWPAAADESPASAEHGERPAELTPAAEALLDEFDDTSRLLLSDDVPALAYSDEFVRPFSSLSLRKSSVIERMSEIRRLSLLTLAEVGDAQLFFGVNSDGTLGLHFGVSSRKSRRAGRELMRMPYLEDPPPFATGAD